MPNVSRVAVEVPLQCYGVEYDRADSMCQKCPHAKSCSGISQTRRGKVKLNKVEFDFVPADLSKFSVQETDDVEALYRLCFRLVFGDEQPDSLRKFQDADHRLMLAAEQARCSTKLFMMCVMLARRQLAPGTRFYASYLFAKGAGGLVNEYRDMARDKYGTFDSQTLGSLTGGDELTKAKVRLMNSEVLAGMWIVGHKLRFSGSPTEMFYAENELKLDPAWLCLEPTYYEWHDRHPPVSAAIQKHRADVHRTNGWLRKRKDVATAYFELRSSMFKRAVDEVLDRQGFRSEDFEAPELVTDAVRFWGRLGLAIQHVNCLQLAGVL
jgi:hypothetical protein